MKLSIVTTLYKSELLVEEFYRRMSNAAQKISSDYEIIMVDDGSPDRSLDIACALARTDGRMRVVELSRNFGHHKALMTGLDYAQGGLCFLIDSDLEEDPALVGEFYDRLLSEDVDVVYGFQRVRQGALWERMTGAIAYWLFDSLVSYEIPHNLATVRLMRREYVDALLRHREQQTIIGGLWAITGFRQVGLPINKSARGNTTYSFGHRWRILVDSITSFSQLPLVAIFYLGIGISVLTVAVGISLILYKLLLSGNVTGWASLMLSIWLLGGLMIFCVGILGIYVARIFIETKGRPYTIIRRFYMNDPASAMQTTSAPSTGTIEHKSRPSVPSDSTGRSIRGSE